MDYLRISVTDRCNFRCQYCMPEDIQFQDKSHILSYEEMLVFAEACLQLGVTKVRVTGGEPLVRRGVVWFVSQLKDLRSEEHTSELQSRQYLVCRLLLEKKTIIYSYQSYF